MIGRRVDPSVQRVVKMHPYMPPVRGDVVLVDGVRCRVTSCRVRWDGLEWTIRSLRCRPAADRVGFGRRRPAAMAVNATEAHDRGRS